MSAAAGPPANIEECLELLSNDRYPHLCHRIGGAGGTVGLALDGIALRRSDPAWYVRFLRDPAAVVPDAKMPLFGQLPEPQLQALAAYLLSLK